MNDRHAQRIAAGRKGNAVHAAKQASVRNELISEIEHLVEAGESARRIVTGVGYTKPTSLERRLIRAGRLDLAAIVRPSKAAS